MWAILCAVASSAARPENARKHLARMQKDVSEKASFAVYRPQGWTVEEGVTASCRTLTVSDPRGERRAAMSCGTTVVQDVVAIARSRLAEIGAQDLDLRDSRISGDRTVLVSSGFYTDRRRARREVHIWITLRDGHFTCSRIEAPAGQLEASRPLLLTILSNVRVLADAFRLAPTPNLGLVRRRLRDGSATFQMPRRWQLVEFGRGGFLAQDRASGAQFTVSNAAVISPQLGVHVPGAVVAPYQPPHRGLPEIARQLGLARDVRVAEVIPRPDIVRMVQQIYTLGPVDVEEFVYTFTADGRRLKGYTFGISFGSRLNTNWSLWHMSVAAPVGSFDSLVPNFVRMASSYSIDDEYAREYIARGTARLRVLQDQTARLIARNATEIRQMMQAAYDERQRSLEYIDYQRTNWIRGHQDWISHVEGGTVYHTDSWGTENTVTGEYWEGKHYDYVHFRGRNPKYPEDMTPIDSRELYERHQPRR